MLTGCVRFTLCNRRNLKRPPRDATVPDPLLIQPQRSAYSPLFFFFFFFSCGFLIFFRSPPPPPYPCPPSPSPASPRPLSSCRSSSLFSSLSTGWAGQVPEYNLKLRDLSLRRRITATVTNANRFQPTAKPRQPLFLRLDQRLREPLHPRHQLLTRTFSERPVQPSRTRRRP